MSMTCVFEQNDKEFFEENKDGHRVDKQALAWKNVLRGMLAIEDKYGAWLCMLHNLKYGF